MGTENFVGRQREGTAAHWNAVLAHPFLLGMSEGSLARSAFQRYMLQDYLFLVEY